MLIRFPLLYLPPLSWFAWGTIAGSVILGSEFAYRKQTYRNRCYIMSANGVLPLTVPVSKPLLSAPFSTIIPDPARSWQRLHWRAIESSYSRSPYFLYYKDALEPFFRRGITEGLRHHNLQLILVLADLLQVPLNEAIPAQKAVTSGGVLDLSGHYLRKEPLPVGLSLNFPEYRQVFAEKFAFVPDLSVIDMLFNLGPESKTYMQQMTASLR